MHLLGISYAAGIDSNIDLLSYHCCDPRFHSHSCLGFIALKKIGTFLQHFKQDLPLFLT